MLARAATKAARSLQLATGARNIWLARRTLDELVTHSYLAGAILDHPDPAHLRDVLVKGLGLRELAVPPLPSAAGATVCVGHAAWPGQPLAEWPRVPPSDRFRLSIRPLATAAARRGLALPKSALSARADDAMAFLDSALQEAELSPSSLSTSTSKGEPFQTELGSGKSSADWIDDVIPSYPLLTVGVVDVDAACARLEALGWATVASPAVSARDPPAEMGVRPDEDSALTAAVVQDASGVQLELVGGFEAPRIASVWAQPPSTERCKVRLCRAASMHALNPLSAPGHPAPLHLTYTAHPAETSIALVGQDLAESRGKGGRRGNGEDAEGGGEEENPDQSVATARAHAWSWLQGLAGELLPGQRGGRTARVEDEVAATAATANAGAGASAGAGAANSRTATAGVTMVEVGLRSEGMLEACDAAERLASEGALAGILAACGPAGEGLSADARAALGLGGGEGDPVLTGTADGESDGFPVWVVAGEGVGDVSVLMRGESQALGESADAEDVGRPAVMGR